MSWWNDEPLIISAVQCKFEDDDLWTLNEYVAKSGFNTEQLLHLTGKGHMAYYDEHTHGEKLDEYLEQSKKHGIRQIIYYNTHCLTKDITDIHPDWQQLKRDGSPIPAYSIYTLNCINGGWYDDFEKNITDLCHHDIDGIFLDGPVMREDGCYCDTCKKLFKERFGKSIYEGTRMELQIMRVDSVTEYIKKTHMLVKGINPEILIYLNNSALRADITGSNSRKVEPYVDMIGAEGGFVRADNKTSLWSISSKAKHIETIAKDKPAVTFLLGNQSSLAYYMHTSAETLILYAQAYANGTNVWYGMSGSASMFKDSEGAKTAVWFNNFVRSNRDLYKKSRSCADVALMWSQESANNYSSSIEQSDFTAEKSSGFKERGDHYQELMSFYDILTRSHIQFDIIDEINVLECLDKYKVIILPDCACLGDDVADALKAYVEKGGTILSTFDTGFYNSDGSYGIRPKLSRVQGISEVEDMIVYPATGTAYQKPDNSSWIFKDVTAPLIPNPLLSIKCRPAVDAITASTSLSPMASVYQALPTEGFPGIIINKYGKGSSIYITGTFGVCYADRAHKDYMRIVKNVIDHACTPLIETDCPESVEMVLRYQEGRYILHIINLTGEMTRPFNRIIPIRDINISLNLKKINSEPFAIRKSVLGNVRTGKDKVSFTIDTLKDYEVIVIPCENKVL